MMFGTRKEFEYFQCKACGCLQISQIPKNLSQYYPSDYTAHKPHKSTTQRNDWLMHNLQKQRCRTALFDRHHILNKILKTFVKYPSALHTKPNDVSSIGGIIRTAGIKRFDARILDVGCGIYSHWLASLENLGFTNLLGVDPLIPENQTHGGVSIVKSVLSEVGGRFDLITLHHSLEHIPDQLSTLVQIGQHLSPDGVCMVRIPIVPSKVWERYKTNWVEFDPPRHLYLHSVGSLKTIAGKAGLEVFDVQYDSTAFEFYGSEMYARGIPLTDANSPWVNYKSTMFTREEIDNFKTLAKAANEERQGGRAAFFLRKACS
jgi:2-polyprenyl-3-methyl-5-hydroxy-6-metoxy-1,4-benzoquinol methylase